MRWHQICGRQARLRAIFDRRQEQRLHKACDADDGCGDRTQALEGRLDPQAGRATQPGKMSPPLISWLRCWWRSADRWPWKARTVTLVCAPDLFPTLQGAKTPSSRMAAKVQSRAAGMKASLSSSVSASVARQHSSSKFPIFCAVVCMGLPLLTSPQPFVRLHLRMSFGCGLRTNQKRNLPAIKLGQLVLAWWFIKSIEYLLSSSAKLFCPYGTEFPVAENLLRCKMSFDVPSVRMPDTGEYRSRTQPVCSACRA